MYSVVPQRTWPCCASSPQSQVKLITLIKAGPLQVCHTASLRWRQKVFVIYSTCSQTAPSVRNKHHLDVRFHVSVTNNCIMSVLHQQMSLWVNYNIYIKIFLLYKTWGCLSLHQIIKYMTFWSHNWLIKKDRTAVDELMPTLIINKHIGNIQHDKNYLVYDFVSYQTI